MDIVEHIKINNTRTHMSTHTLLALSPVKVETGQTVRTFSWGEDLEGSAVFVEQLSFVQDDLVVTLYLSASVLMGSNSMRRKLEK